METITNDNPNEEEIKFIRSSLKDEYGIIYPDNYKEINLIEYNEERKIVAGLIGCTYWGWLYVNILWVNKEYRNKGIGKKLIKKAEKEALERGCKYAHLDTMDFQAPGFYKKLSYEIKYETENIPEGHKKYYMIKELK